MSNEKSRYIKNFTLEGIGEFGQNILLNSKVLIIGVGGLGSSCAWNLSANGIGTIGLIDYDYVEESNLHRQLLYDNSQIGQNKVEAAKETLSAINPDIKIEAKCLKITEDNILDHVKKYEVIIDGTDNLHSHLIINSACQKLKIPSVVAGVNGYDGFVFSVIPPKTHCYGCLWSNKNIENSNNSVYGPLANILGAMQASEAIKILLGIESSLLKNILLINLYSNIFKEIELVKDKNCSECSNK